MYKVIIADDEAEIRRGIIRSVCWEELGFKVIGEAANGLEALELVEKLEPDLLISDIRMPYVNGLELARRVREINSVIKIAFLSGYDEFTYAQQAIEYNIISYMLKPIATDEFKNELSKIRELMDRDVEEFYLARQNQNAMSHSEFILSLILGGEWEYDEELEQKLCEIAIECGLIRETDLGKVSYLVMVTSLSETESRYSVEVSPNVVNSIVNKYIQGISCSVRGKIVTIMAATPSGYVDYMPILTEEIVQSFRKILRVNCAVGVGRTEAMISNLYHCYQDAINALGYLGKGESGVRYITDEERESLASQNQIVREAQLLKELLINGTEEKLDQHLREYSEKILSENASLRSVKFNITQMLANVIAISYSAGGDKIDQVVRSGYQVERAIMNNSIREALQQYVICCRKAKEVISDQRKRSGKQLYESALELIDQQYTDSDLSLGKISEQLSVSMNYLSSTIRKSTGKTFVELLTERRINHATVELQTTTKKIREIAEGCGYRDQHYFSYCFKKMTGKSPNQCRREYEESK